MTTDGAPTTLAYSVTKLGQALNIGRSTIYEEIRTGRLRVRKAGARTLIAHDDAMAWLNGLPTQPVDRTADVSCSSGNAELVFGRPTGGAAGGGTSLPPRRAKQDWEGKPETVVETPLKFDAVLPDR